MKPSEFFTVEIVVAMGLAFVGALVAFGLVYYFLG
jgi:hypothetical protein